MELQGIVADFEATLNKLKEYKEKKENEIAANQHTVEALFDGLKFTNTQETAIEFVSPMVVKANLWFTIGGESYVCIKNGTATTETIGEYFTKW